MRATICLACHRYRGAKIKYFSVTIPAVFDKQCQKLFGPVLGLISCYHTIIQLAFQLPVQEYTTEYRISPKAKPSSALRRNLIVDPVIHRRAKVNNGIFFVNLCIM